MTVLWRLDAVHDTGEGAFVKYFRDSTAAARSEKRFAACGWACDFYPLDLPWPATPVMARKLCDGVWPLEDHEAIVNMLDDEPVRWDDDETDPVSQAAINLAAIMLRQRHGRQSGGSDAQ